MRIVCPSCQSRYEVPEDRLRPGQAVRCARCGEEWVPVAGPPPQPAPEPEPVVQAAPLREEAPGPKPVSEPEWRAPARRSGAGAAWAGWILTIIILAGLSWAASTYRAQIMQAWPASTRLYAAFGAAAATATGPR